MKRTKGFLAAICALTVGVLMFFPDKTYAEEKKDISLSLNGESFELTDEDKYELSKAKKTKKVPTRFSVEGDYLREADKNGFPCFAVKSGNLKLMFNDQFEKELISEQDPKKWHIINERGKVVDGTKLGNSVGLGAIVVQTSKDGSVWINSDSETDIYNKISSINNRVINGEESHAFYNTTNVQLSNGCFYRIIVVFRLQQEVDPSKFLLINKTNTEEKECMEIYQFYAYDPSVRKEEILDTKNAYEFSTVCRVDNQDGFDNPVRLSSDDPHIDWCVGKFYVSGYTDVIRDKNDDTVPIFLKVPGDRAALWFNLEQELDKCDGKTDIKVEATDSGSDKYFGTPTIKNFGRGTLIVRKKDKTNHPERYIYTNYLEASATTGANTRVDLYEEGDYEVALDYQLHYDKPFVFGTTSTKTLAYQVFFKFKVRNGDISAFIRDVDTNQFITNANVAEKGFYIDVANSQYLNMTIKREVLSEGLNGLVEDTKFSAVAKEGRNYTEEGIYTVTVKNLVTDDSITKTVYVGNRDIMLAHMKTGMPISEINEKVKLGATISDDGTIIDPEPEIEEETEGVSETDDKQISTEGDYDQATPADTSKATDKESVQGDKSEANTDDSIIETSEAENDSSMESGNHLSLFIVIISIVICVIVAIVIKRKKGDRG